MEWMVVVSGFKIASKSALANAVVAAEVVLLSRLNPVNFFAIDIGFYDDFLNSPARLVLTPAPTNFI